MKKIIVTVTQIFGLLAYSQAQDTITIEKKEPLTYEASYVGDNINNLSGGIKTGYCYLGMANIRMNFDTENAKLWKGGSFYINAANTHGNSPSTDLLGDMQVASNIDAGNHTYIQELWYKQTIKKFEFTVGLQDLNVEFANTENGAVFMNSSFGILPIVSGNITPPIFPLTSLGLTAKWNVSEKISWLNAIYDGSPTNFDYNPYNVKWQFLSGDGLLAISEIQINSEIKKMLGTYKIGVFSHSHIIEESLNNEIPDSVNHNIFGVYAYVDQKIWQKENKSISLFTQLGYSPSETSSVDHFMSFGTNINGFIKKSGDDILGLAIAHEHLVGSSNHETAIEVTYQYPISSNIFIQPNFQYIINPAGTDAVLQNCLTGNLRFGIIF